MNPQIKRKPRTADSHLTIRLWPALVYMTFIVYGSLLPFEMKPIPLDVAWANFQQIPTLLIGVSGRADFVANILLYIPAGFLLCGWLVGPSSRPVVKTIGAVVGLAFLVALALSVEFIQQYFPARTVSRNDLIADIAGAAIGVGVWLLVGARFVVAISAVVRGGRESHAALIAIYVISYLFLSMLPYDFLLSFDEWQQKLASDKVGAIFAPACGELCFLKLVPEVLAAVPLGMFLVFIQTRRQLSLIVAAITGILLGLLIEGLQLLIDSGVTQGVSIASRGIGVALGAGLVQFGGTLDWQGWRRVARRIILLSVIPYLVAVAWLNRWFANPWLNLEAAMARLPDVHFLPFYYHYYTAEAVAAVSVLFQFSLYFPIGVAVWLWRWGGQADLVRRGPVLPALLAALLAVVMETGKLFVLSQHPDPTDVPIAATAALIAYWVLHRLVCPEVRGSDQAVTAIVSTPSAESSEHISWGRVIGAAALTVGGLATITSPIAPLIGTLALIFYVGALWRWPGLWMVAILALLPVMDFTPWSGRLYWTEFDTLLLATLGVSYLRLASRGDTGSVNFRLRPLAKILLLAFALSFVFSLGIGLLPLPALDLNAFTSYTSSYNALRAAKGFGFALACFPLIKAEWREPERAARRIAWGLSLGLAIEVCYVLWERITFSGPFNFDTDYRITGSFPGLHIGGAYIEGYLVTVLPFVLLWAWQARRMSVTVAAAALYALGAYSVMVTFSRGGQVAFALVTLLALFGFVRLSLRERARGFVSVAALIIVAGVVTAVAWPIFSGKYSQSRLATTDQDIATRTSHWSDAVNILQKRGESLLGAGIGTFPEAFFWGSNTTSRPATYSFAAENGNSFLRLGAGEILYFEQLIPVKANRKYTLALDLRSGNAQASITAPMCEKALLYSYACAWSTVELKGTPGRWSQYRILISTANFGASDGLFARPVKLSLFNGGAGTIVDVDNVALYDESGHNLVRNGDFAAGMRYWFFSTDSHLAWHVKNLFAHVLFEQGWIGLLFLVALLTYVTVRLLHGVRHADALALTLFLSLVGFVSVGSFDSLVDETRIGFLFYFILLAALRVSATQLVKSYSGIDTHRSRRKRRN